MAVEIELDLKSSNATGKIGAIAASLKGLEQVSDDLEIDLDADVGDITSEIEDFSDALDGLDSNLNLADDLSKAADDLDDALDSEMDVNINGGAGDKGQGGTEVRLDSGFESAAKRFADSDSSGGSVTDGGSRANLFERIYGEHTLMGESDIGNLHKMRTGQQSNLGKHDPDFQMPRHPLMQVGKDGRFGMEPVSMDLRRQAADISMDEFDAAGTSNLLDGDDSGSDRILAPMDDIREQQRQLLRNAGLDPDSVRDGDYDATDGRSDSFAEMNEDARERAPETDDEIRRATERGSGLGIPDIDSDDEKGNSALLRRIRNIETLDDAMEGLSDGQRKVGRHLRKLKPSMGQLYSLIAAVIPVAVALGTQLLGVAAALGSVGVAAGGIMGLGLLGHGENLEESMANAQDQIGDLKEEMFDVFQPTMELFAPIQDRMFDAMPGGMEGIAESMEGLTVYEDTLFALGDSLASGMERAVDIIVENEQAISQLSLRFGRLIGSGLLDFFEWLIQAASENQELLVELGSDMMTLLAAAYNLAMAITQVVGAFSFWFHLLLGITELLDSNLFIALVQIVGWMYILGKTVGMIYSLAVGFKVLTNFVFDATYAMLGYEMSTWGAVAATLALVAAVSLLTFGASAVFGSIGASATMGSDDIPDLPGGGGGVGNTGNVGGGGGNTVYNDNRSFTIESGGMEDYATQKDVESSITRNSETDAATSRPDVSVTTEETDPRND